MWCWCFGTDVRHGDSTTSAPTRLPKCLSAPALRSAVSAISANNNCPGLETALSFPAKILAILKANCKAVACLACVVHSMLTAVSETRMHAEVPLHVDTVAAFCYSFPTTHQTTHEFPSCPEYVSLLPSYFLTQSFCPGKDCTTRP